MTEAYRPPFFPEQLKEPDDFWLGQDPFSPQLVIVNGLPIDMVRKAYEEKGVVGFAIDSRTADMDEEEPNDQHGSIQITIEHLIDGGEDGIHFLGKGQNIPFTDRGEIWVWNYINRTGGADVRVNTKRR